MARHAQPEGYGIEFGQILYNGAFRGSDPGTVFPTHSIEGPVTPPMDKGRLETAINDVLPDCNPGEMFRVVPLPGDIDVAMATSVIIEYMAGFADRTRMSVVNKAANAVLTGVAMAVTEKLRQTPRI